MRFVFKHPSKDQQQHISKMLGAVGHRVFDFVHYAACKAVELPKPLGSAVAFVEGIVQPIAQAAENQSLRVLNFLDNQLYNVGEVVESMISLPKNATQKLVGEIQRRGIIGSAADCWVENESYLRKRSDTIARVLHKLPGFRLVSPVLDGVSSFALTKLSQWLVEHSEVKEKHLSNPETKSPDEDDDHHAFVEAKVADDDESEEPLEANLEKREAVKDAVSVEDHTISKPQQKKKQLQQEEEDEDELTKLIDAGWGLGSL